MKRRAVFLRAEGRRRAVVTCFKLQHAGDRQPREEHRLNIEPRSVSPRSAKFYQSPRCHVFPLLGAFYRNTAHQT